MKTTKTVCLFTPLILALLISACSTIPKSAQVMTAMPNFPVNKAYQVLDGDTFSGVESPSVASIRWQDFYADPKLKSLIKIGLNHNKDLQKAILAIQNSRAQYQITTTDDMPKLGISGGLTRMSSADNRNANNGYNVGLAMTNYEIDLWGKVANAKDAALHGYLATNSAKDAVQISLISNIAQSYVNLSYSLAQRQLAVETLKTREHSFDITKKRFEAGIDSRSPSLQAEASLEAAKLAIYQADTGIMQARNALQLLLGASIPEELMPDMAVKNITTQSLFSAGLPSELLYYRPDIVQAEHALKAAGANINVARAAYFPSISLSGNLGFSSSSLSNLLKSGAFAWSFGPAISLPIFDSGVRRANYEMAEIAQKNALVTYEKAIQTAFKEVGDVLAARATLSRQLESQYKLQKNHQQIYQIAHARFRSGLDNYLSVLDAERSLFANQQNILSLELQKILSQIQLYQALGGGATLTTEKVASLQKQREAMRTTKLTNKEQVTAVSAVAADGDVEIVQSIPMASNVGESVNTDVVLPSDGIQ